MESFERSEQVFIEALVPSARLVIDDGPAPERFARGRAAQDVPVAA